MHNDLVGGKYLHYMERIIVTFISEVELDSLRVFREIVRANVVNEDKLGDPVSKASTTMQYSSGGRELVFSKTPDEVNVKLAALVVVLTIL